MIKYNCEVIFFNFVCILLFIICEESSNLTAFFPLTFNSHLSDESVGSAHWGDPQAAKTGSMDGTGPTHFLIGADGYASLGSQPEAQKEIPFMDHWSVPRPHVSLRDIMTEEQALQDNMEKVTHSHTHTRT